MSGDIPIPTLARSRRRLILTLTAGTVLAGALTVVVVAVSRRDAKDAPALWKTASRSNDPELLLRIGERLRQLGAGEQSFEVIARAYEQRDQDPRFAAALADILAERGEVQDALPLASGMAKIASGSAEVRAALAIVHLNMGRYDSALKESREAVRRDPGSPRAWRAFARACAAEKLQWDAWPAFQRAIELTPEDGGLLADYGEALDRFGHVNEAERALRQSVRLRPRDSRVLSLLAAHLGRRARDTESGKEAIDLMRKAIAAAPAAAEPRYQLGRLLLDVGDPGAAVPVLEDCLKLDPSFGEARLPLARAYQETGHPSTRIAFAAYRRYADYRRNAAHLSQRLRRNPGSVELLKRMAGVQQSEGRTELARHYLKLARSGGRAPGLAAASHSHAPASAGGTHVAANAARGRQGGASGPF